MEMNQGSCGCAPKVICPNCFLAKEIKRIHDTGLKEAEFDALTEEEL
jgi:hypothetical protein